jgi:hypothetical protein
MIWTIINIIVWIIAVASIVAAVSPHTKNTKDDAFVGKINKAINFLALNFKK